jgi:hypothetical protein
MEQEDGPEALCEEASLLFQVYLKRLKQLHEAMDSPADKGSVANIQINLDVAYDAARDARRAYFHHCNRHGCRA